MSIGTFLNPGHLTSFEMRLLPTSFCRTILFVGNPMPSEPSWGLKVIRAHQHLAAITKLVDRIAGDSPRPIRVAERHEAGRWSYTAHSDLVIDPMLAVIIGEFLYDLRSALDHIAAANVPAERIGVSQFPIFTEDIWQPVPDATDAGRVKGQRGQWNRWTTGMPPAIVNLIKDMQPYQNASKYSSNPDNHALAILNEYQNADKHRELNITSLLIDDPRATVTWPTGHRDEIDYRNATPEMLLREGGTCFDSDVPVKVDLNGTVRIAMARSSDTDHRELPRSLVEIFDTVGDFLARIEDAMPSHADPSGEAPG